MPTAQNRPHVQFNIVTPIWVVVPELPAGKTLAVVRTQYYHSGQVFITIYQDASIPSAVVVSNEELFLNPDSGETWSIGNWLGETASDTLLYGGSSKPAPVSPYGSAIAVQPLDAFDATLETIRTYICVLNPESWQNAPGPAVAELFAERLQEARERNGLMTTTHGSTLSFGPPSQIISTRVSDCVLARLSN